MFVPESQVLCQVISQGFGKEGSVEERRDLNLFVDSSGLLCLCCMGLPLRAGLGHPCLGTLVAVAAADPQNYKARSLCDGSYGVELLR